MEYSFSRLNKILVIASVVALVIIGGELEYLFIRKAASPLTPVQSPFTTERLMPKYDYIDNTVMSTSSAMQFLKFTGFQKEQDIAFSIDQSAIVKETGIYEGSHFATLGDGQGTKIVTITDSALSVFKMMRGVATPSSFNQISKGSKVVYTIHSDLVNPTKSYSSLTIQ